MNTEESIKRKRGRPRKYRPDGTMVISSTADVTITQAPDVFSPTPPSSGSIPPPSGVHETVHSSGSRGATTPSRVTKLTDIHRSCEDEVSELTPSDMEKIQADCVPQIQSKVNQFVSEYSDFKSEESIKRKGGRPRKYRPDGTMVVSSTADVTITQAPDIFLPTPSSGSIPPPSGAHETVHSSGSRGATTPCRVTKLTDIHRSCKDEVSELTPSDMEKIQADCVPQIQSKANQFVSEYSDFKSEESIKRKGGRPRKYRPDSTMVVSSTADVTITQAPDVFSPTPPSSGSIPPPSGAHETVHSSGWRGATTPSRVTKLTDIHRRFKDEVSELTPLDMEKIQADCVPQIQCKANQFVSEYSDFKSEESIKRKRGRPRKYRPDGTVVVSSTADVTITQAPDVFSPTPSSGSIPPPSEAHETVPSSGSLDLATIRSQVTKLSDIHRSCKDDISELTSSDMEKILADCVLQIQSRADELVSEYLDFDSLRIEDLDANLEHLKGELKLVEDENAKISNEIDVLNETYVEDLNRLESDLGGLEHSLNFIEAQGLKEAEVGAHDHCFARINDQLNWRTVPGDDNLEIMRLNDQIVKDKITLKLLHDLDCAFKRLDAVEKTMDAWTGIKVLDFEGSCIRLSLRTYIPNLEGLLGQQKVQDIIEPSELNHELLIEVMDGTMELKNIEIFPNDVYIGEIIDAAKSLRHLHEGSSSLKWSVSKVEERIILCTLRRYVTKGANKSRHSFEYLDIDEMIVAHIVDGVDAFIKVPQGWPLLNSSLKLVSLKSSDHNSRGISLSFLCKVEELANSLDVHIRKILSSFVDAIEEILVQQMRLQLHSDDIPRK